LKAYIFSQMKLTKFASHLLQSVIIGGRNFSRIGDSLDSVLLWHTSFVCYQLVLRKTLLLFNNFVILSNPDFYQINRAPPWSNGSVLDYLSLPPVFESRRGHIWKAFHLWLRLITFGGRSDHLAYLVHKNGRKTSIIIIY